MNCRVLVAGAFQFAALSPTLPETEGYLRHLYLIVMVAKTYGWHAQRCELLAPSLTITAKS